MLILYFVPIEINTFAAYGIGVLFAFTVMYRVDRRNYNQKVFMAATFFSLRWLSGYMTRIITDAIYSIKEMLMLTIPSITAMTGYGIMIQYQTSSGMSWMEPISGLYNGLAFLYFGISIVTIVVMTVLFQNIKARQEEKLQNELLAIQVDNMEKHIRQVESLYQSMCSIKHDMANHILTLERLYVGNNLEEAADYGKELKSALSPISASKGLDAGEIKTGNPVTDVILQELKSEAEKRKIHFQTDFYYPAGTNINAFDVSVILNNALQNALENTTDYPLENTGKSGTPHVSVLSYHRNNAYMIEVSNSFSGSLQ